MPDRAERIPERPDYIAMNLNVEEDVQCSDGIWTVRVSMRNRSFSGLYPAIQINDTTGKKHVTLSSLSEYAPEPDCELLRASFYRMRSRAYERFADEIAESKRIERQLADIEQTQRMMNGEAMLRRGSQFPGSARGSAAPGRPHGQSQYRESAPGGRGPAWKTHERERVSAPVSRHAHPRSSPSPPVSPGSPSRFVERAPYRPHAHTSHNARGGANVPSQRPTVRSAANGAPKAVARVEAANEDASEGDSESSASSAEESDDGKTSVELDDDSLRGRARDDRDAVGERPRKRMKGDAQLLDGDEEKVPVEYTGPAMVQQICTVDEQKWRIQIVLELEVSRRGKYWVPTCKFTRGDGTTYSLATVQRDVPDSYNELISMARNIRTRLPVT